MPTYVGLIIGFGFLVVAFLCGLVGMAYRAPQVPMDGEPVSEPDPTIAEAIRTTDPRAVLATEIWLRSRDRIIEADRDWSTLCQVVNGHQRRCGCDDCDDLMAIVYQRETSLRDVLGLINERREARERA